MIPYFELTLIPGTSLPVFGVLVFSGFVLGGILGARCAPHYGLPRKQVLDLLIWVVIPAFIGSHFLQILFYQPERFVQEPLSQLIVSSGLSSFGGLLTALIAFVLYLRLNRLQGQWLAIGDLVAQGFILGWVFGRLGCTVVHDHIGIETDFWLAIQFPDGPRHDLGFYEFLYTLLVLLPLSTLIYSRGLPAGNQMVAFALCYGLFRLFADSLRIGDARYAGFTPGQYGAVLLMLIGVLIYVWMRQQTRKPLPSASE